MSNCPGPVPASPPRLQQRALGVELQDVRIAAPVAHEQEDLPLEADGEVGRLVQERGVVRVDGQQHLAFRIHLAHRVAVDVGGPDVALRVDAHPVRPVVLALAPGADEGAVRLELHQRVRAAVEHQDAVPGSPADAGRRAHLDVVRDLQPVRHGPVPQIRRILHLGGVGSVQHLGPGGPAEKPSVSATTAANVR